MRNLTSLRILLIEDEPIVAVLAEDMLDAIDCIVVATVATVADAQTAMTSIPFDLAMVDINLDGEDGLIIADTLRERGTPYLITTGYDAQAVAPGHPVLAKPYALSDLESAIMRCAGRA